ncbi:class I SAM-dependent methyltransferase [bacterium]|nr:class I SAM-dependent methyltransferase [bacterium]
MKTSLENEYTALMKRVTEVESTYWWCVGRTAILHNVFDQFMPKNSKILNLGSGPGGIGNLASDYGWVADLDIDLKNLLKDSSVKNRTKICADGFSLPIKANSIDVLICLDVLEHIEEDTLFLKEIKRVLNNMEGRLFLTVPAYSWMWSSHDDILGHRKRYTKKTLLRIMTNMGFQIQYITYYNTVLFPLSILNTIKDRMISKFGQRSEQFPGAGGIVNDILTAIFSSERWFIPKRSFLFGNSLLVYAKINCSR